MKYLWPADSLRKCAHDILIDFNAAPLPHYGLFRLPPCLRGDVSCSERRLFPVFRQSFWRDFILSMPLWLLNTLIIRLIYDCSWMVFFFSIYSAPFAELSRLHFRSGMLTSKIVKPRGAGEPDEFEKTISQVRLEYFSKQMQSESLISRPMGFCWDGSLLFYVLNHCSSVEPFCYFYTNGLYARLVES